MSRTYDAGRRLTSQTFGNGIVEAMSYRNDNLPETRQTPVGNFSFGWDANKNKTSETITGTLSGYSWSTGTTGFDDQNRLVARNQGSGGTQLNEAYALTPVGDMSSTTTNGVAQARTHGPAHELLSIGAAAVTEDSRGNILTDGFGQTFAWDNLGHLASADTDSNGTADVTYAYDALRRRVKKTTTGEGGQSMVFVSLGHDLIADYLAGAVAGNPQRNYAYTGRIDEPVAMIDYTTAGTLGASVAEPFYYHMDANWHVRGLTNSTGTAVEAYAYGTYGTLTIIDTSNGTFRTSSALSNRWMFTAREWDKGTQTYHFRYRTFSSRLNRFTSRDPMGYVDGTESYRAYFVPCGVDPGGLDDTHAGNMTGIPDGNTAGISNGQPIYKRGDECYILTPNGEGRIPCPAANGTWTFNPELQPDSFSGKGFGGDITFEPSTGCPKCKEIQLVQTARSYASEGVLSDWANGTGLDLLKPPYVTEGGWFVDVPIDQYEDRIRVPRNSRFRQPTYYYGDYISTHLRIGSSDPTIRDAQIWDAPSGYYRVDLETCALCVDSGKWLGCQTWSMVNGGSGGSPKPMLGGPSREFLNAITLFQNNGRKIKGGATLPGTNGGGM